MAGKKVREFVRDVFAIDLRVLGIVRIIIGVFCLFYFSLRIPVFSLFFSEEGLMPLPVRYVDLGIGTGRGTSYSWSLFFVSDSHEFGLLILLIGILTSLALIAGFSTRAVTLIIWILICSTRARQPYIGDGGDAVLKVLLFWSMFIPWGARFSVDRWRKHRAGVAAGANLAFSAATVALLIQLVLVYWFSFLMKYGPDWQETKLAVYYALNNELLTNENAKLIRKFEKFHRFSNEVVLFVEVLAPFLLISCSRESLARVIGVSLGVLLHIFIATFFEFGIFPYVLIVYWLAFLPWPRSCPDVAGNAGYVTSSSLLNLFVCFCLFLTILWNIFTLPGSQRFGSMPDPLRKVAFGLHLNQRWAFFAPNVNTKEAYFVLNDRTTGKFYNLHGFEVEIESLKTVYEGKFDRQYLAHLYHSNKSWLLSSLLHWRHRKTWPENLESDSCSFIFVVRDVRTGGNLFSFELEEMATDSRLKPTDIELK